MKFPLRDSVTRLEIYYCFISWLQMLGYGEQILTIAVLSILITAPLGAIRKGRFPLKGQSRKNIHRIKSRVV
jgi:hypothetical protein